MVSKLVCNDCTVVQRLVMHCVTVDMVGSVTHVSLIVEYNDDIATGRGDSG